MNAHQLDELIARGAEAIKRRYPSKQMAYGRAAGVTKSTANRHYNGDKHSPATHYLRGVLIVGWSLIAESIAMLNADTLKRLTETDLHKRRDELTELEHEADAESDRQMLRAIVKPTAEQLEHAAKADIRLAEIALERAAINRELVARQLNSGGSAGRCLFGPVLNG